MKITTRAEVVMEPETPSQRGVYGISVAAELSGVGPQALRSYERHGLLHPARTDGGTRRYSDADLHRLQRITDLIGTGVNLAGIAQILHLQTTNTQLKADNAQLRATQEADHDRAHPARR